MKEVESEISIRRYLLGELNDTEREKVEERLFTDSSYNEEALIVEEELLEDYVGGALSDRERELFLKNYLTTPRQRHKLKVAMAFERQARETPLELIEQPEEAGFFQRLLESFRSSLFLQLSSAVVIIVLLAGAWFFYRNFGITALQAEFASLNKPGSNLSPPGPTVVGTSLSSFVLRESGNLPAANIGAQTEVILLLLPTLSSPPPYRAVLKDAAGHELASVSGLDSRTERQIVQLPAKQVPSGDYVLTIKSGTSGDDLGDYSFRVIRR